MNFFCAKNAALFFALRKKLVLFAAKKVFLVLQTSLPENVFSMNVVTVSNVSSNVMVVIIIFFDTQR